jgi:hypothetical protein
MVTSHGRFLILRRHDTVPSILYYPLLDDSESQEPSPKKTKHVEENRTIAEKLRACKYSTFNQINADVEFVCASLMKALKEREDSLSSGPYATATPLSEEDVTLLASIMAFQKVFKTLVGSSSIQTLSNGTAKEIKTEDANEFSVMDASKPGRPILTLFANAQGPKQLFSSFQKPIRVGDQTDGDEIDIGVEVTIPLRELGLPNFVVSTTIPPSSVGGQPAKGKTFGERFPPPKNTPHLQPPKSSNKLATKASTIGWVSGESLSRQITRRSYNWCVTRLNTGKSLDYSKVLDMQSEPVSPEERRRQRDRALSIGSAQPPQSEAARLAVQQVKDETLFRNAFSSFAPCYDNSDAIVPTEVKNEIWWSRIGQYRAERVFAPATVVDEVEEIGTEEEDAEDKEMKEAIENFDPALFQGTDPFNKEEQDETMADILQEVNDLIETLYSYQRIRGSTLASTTAPTTPVSQRTALTEIIGTPSTPSAAEVEIFKTLQEQLVLLITQLPPYLVTRLNGDKLQELNISTQILFETDDAPGILEDNTPTPAIKEAAAHLDSQASAQRTYARNAPLAPTRSNSNYYPQSQGQPRTPSASYPRPSAPQGYAGGYTNTPGRPHYGAPQPGFAQGVYAQTPMRMGYQSTPQSQYYQQNQQAQSRMNFAQTYQGTPTNHVRQYPQQHMPNYQQRSSSGHGAYGYQQPVPSPHMRNVPSPMQAGHVPPPLATPLGMPQQGLPGLSATSPHLRNPSGGRTQYYPPAQANAIGPSGFHTTMTREEQQVMMDRQRQLAMQNQARSAAMGQANANMNAQPPSAYTTPSRNSSNTPAPPSAGMNGTPR